MAFFSLWASHVIQSNVFVCLHQVHRNIIGIVLTNIYVHFSASVNLDFYPMQVTGLGIQPMESCVFMQYFINTSNSLRSRVSASILE